MTQDSLHIVKVGGKVLENESYLQPLLHGFTALKARKILVHGGGKRASAVSRKLGITPRMHKGRRITDADSLDVAVMVYAGLTNKQLVASLQALGCSAIGLSGADGNAIQARRRPVGEVDYGFVGDIENVNTDLLRHLLEGGHSPVFCAITHDGKGQLYNTNADSIAAGLAGALSAAYAVRLTYCFEKPGVLRDADDDSSLITRLSKTDYQSFLDEGAIHSGMIPKLDNAFSALAAGVERVMICGPEGLDGSIATHLYA